NHAELEKYYQDQGFNQAEINSALYNDLKTLGKNLNIEVAQTPIKPASFDVDHQDELSGLAVVKALETTAPQNTQDLLAQNTTKSPETSQQNVKAPQSPETSASSVATNAELYTSKKPFSLEDLEARASKLNSLVNELTPDMLKSKEAKNQDLELDSLIKEAIENRVPYAKLPEAIKSHLT
uniref:hypothetical protein n=1 Tax=Helicobacter suis TaxID=104628 RepID=UPI0013D063D7